MNPIVIALLFIAAGLIFLLAAFSQRRYREVEQQKAKLARGIDAPGIDEDFADQFAPIDGTAGADETRDRGA